MRLVVDSERCQGHGRCYTIAPQVVDTDDDGYAVIIPAGGLIAPGDEAAARAAVANCPEGALSLEG